MTNLEAVRIIDDYNNGSDSTIIGMLETTEAEYISAFQHLIDDGIVWLMKSPYPNNAKHLINQSYCVLRSL